MQRKTKYSRRYALNNLKLHLHCQTQAVHRRPIPLAFSALCIALFHGKRHYQRSSVGFPQPGACFCPVLKFLESRSGFNR